MVIERNITPEEFQDRLTEIGGVNIFDEPNFKVLWGQGPDEDIMYRAGGRWSVDEAHFIGYRDLLKSSGEPCWALLQWHDALEYSTPEEYYVQNYDEATGLQILGEYPYSGRYELLYNMRYREMVDGVLHLETMPLSDYVLDVMVPIIIDAQGISIEKKKAAYEDMLAKEEAAKVSAVEQRLRETALPFGSEAVSYTRQGIRTPSIDKKVSDMSRRWDEISRKARAMKKGFSTRNEAI
jgi:hypothetical protein